MGLFNTAVMLNYNFENFEEKKLCESMKRITVWSISGKHKHFFKVWQINNWPTKYRVNTPMIIFWQIYLLPVKSRYAIYICFSLPKDSHKVNIKCTI